MPDLQKGHGAQQNPKNRFHKQEIVWDEGEERAHKVQLFYDQPKKIISKFQSPDVPGEYSLNAYQGCEHGCVYCYARESHQYWGWSAGKDFESKIIIKENAPELLRETFRKKSYNPKPIMMSGNTDCYQPLERKFELTRQLLQVMLEHRNPVGIITKNALIERDLDILQEMAQLNLVHVVFSVTTRDESLRRKLEPRTASSQKKFTAMNKLSQAGVPTGVMTAPIIPGLNHHEIPELLKQASEAGARTAAYTVVRLNGEIASIFSDWLEKAYPDRKDKVLNQIQSLHGGQVEDRRIVKRMTGEGEYSKMIQQLFTVSKNKYFPNPSMPPLDASNFRRNGGWQLF